MLRRFFADRRSRLGAIALGSLILVALLAPWLSPSDPIAQHDVLRTRFLSPLVAGPDGVMHWLGTDRFGRDMLAPLLYGSRISLTVGLLSVAVSIAIGTALGAVAALAGGAVERTLLGVTDAVLALPRLVLLLALVALFEPSLTLVVVVLGLTGWMPIARLARAEVKGLLRRPFVEAARSAGVTPAGLVARHLVPNALAPLLVAAVLGVGNAIGLEAGLSFLGLGVPPPAPSWGNMIAGGRDALVNAPWIAIAPGIALVITVLGCALLAEGMRRALGD